MKEFVNSEGMFQTTFKESTRELDSPVRLKMERETNPPIRDMVNLRADKLSVGVHDSQEQPMIAADDVQDVIQNADRLPSRESKRDRVSVEVQGLQTQAYRRPRRLRSVTQSSTHRPRHFKQRMGEAAGFLVDKLESPPCGQNEMHHSPAEACIVPESDKKPHQSLSATGGNRNWSSSPTLPAGKAEVVTESFEKSNPWHSEPVKVFGEPQLNQGSSGANDEQRHKFSVPSHSRKSSSMQSHLSKDKSVIENVAGSCSRQDESVVASGPDVQIVRCSPSEQVQPMPWKRKRSTWNGDNSASGSASSTRSIRPRASGSHRMERNRRGLCNVTTQRPIEVDDLESPRRTGVSINLEDDEESTRARQLAQDEILAKFLQEEYNLEAIPADLNFDDAQVARMLQEEENARSMQHVSQSSSHSISPLSYRNSTAMQAVRREMQRVLPTIRSHSSRPSVSSSRTRILRGLRNRSNQQQMRGHLLGGTGQNSDESLFHFPDEIDVDTRLNILAAIESAIQENPSFQELQLERLDRDFDENDYEMLLALDDSNHYHTGASQDRIGQLPISTLQPTDVYEEICSICLELPIVGDKVRRLPCMHGFHQQCVDVWLTRQANCPICKCSL